MGPIYLAIVWLLNRGYHSEKEQAATCKHIACQLQGRGRQGHRRPAVRKEASNAVHPHPSSEEEIPTLSRAISTAPCRALRRRKRFVHRMRTVGSCLSPPALRCVVTPSEGRVRLMQIPAGGALESGAVGGHGEEAVVGGGWRTTCQVNAGWCLGK